MQTDAATALKAQLEAAGVELRCERRCYGNRAGVPDAVVWLRPAIDGMSWCAPILFELEGKGGFHGARRDATEFASRYGNDDHRYHLKWPGVDVGGLSPASVEVTYDLNATPSSTLTGEYETDEDTFYTAVEEWANFIASELMVTADRERYEETEVVWWSVTGRVVGNHPFEVRVPMVMTPTPGVAATIVQYAELTLPMIVVVDGPPTGQEARETAETTVEFAALPRRVTGDSE